jgi:hypothetical protein
LGRVNPRQVGRSGVESASGAASRIKRGKYRRAFPWLEIKCSRCQTPRCRSLQRCATCQRLALMILPKVQKGWEAPGGDVALASTTPATYARDGMTADWSPESNDQRLIENGEVSSTSLPQRVLTISPFKFAPHLISAAQSLCKKSNQEVAPPNPKPRKQVARILFELLKALISASYVAAARLTSGCTDPGSVSPKGCQPGSPFFFAGAQLLTNLPGRSS